MSNAAGPPPREDPQDEPPEEDAAGDAFAPRAQTFHLHITLAHIPCGLFVTSFVLCLLGATKLKEALGPSAKICFFAGAAALPLVMASGIVSWKTKRRRSTSGVFRMKTVWAILLLLAAIATAGPELYRTEPPTSFTVGVAICAVLTAVLGRMGAMIVFDRIGLPEEPEKKP